MDTTRDQAEAAEPTEATEATEATNVRVLLAQFPDQPSAEQALSALEEHGVEARRVELVPRPTRNRLFDEYRLLWGLAGLLAGGSAGFVIGGIAGLLLDVEQGVLVGGSFGVVLTSAIIGAILLGTLGLFGGLGLSESKATEEVAHRAAAKNMAPGEVLLRVEMEGTREELVRDTLADAGASLVTWASASPWDDRQHLEPHRMEEQPAE